MNRQLARLTVFSVVLFGGLAFAQRIAPPKPCKVRIVVTDNRQNPVPNATVELQDSVGLASAGTSMLTGQDGRVEFNSVTGGHRLRITGSEMVTYEGEFEVTPAETTHAEYIRVKMKPPVGGDVQPPGPPVPTVRLKIPAAAEKEYNKGNKLAEKNKWAGATAAYRRAIEKYPDYDLAYNSLGVALSSQHDDAGAKAAFEKAIAITPEYAMAARNLARIVLADRDWKRADDLLRKSLQIEPVNAWALTNAAYAELQLHDFESAVAHARNVNSVPHAGFENAHFIAALALEQLGHPDDARAEYDLYLKEAPSGLNAAQARDALARLGPPAQR